MRTKILANLKGTLHKLPLIWAGLTLMLGLTVGIASPVLAASMQNNLATEFAVAAREFGVPANVLLAVSYNESHWESNPGMSSDGGYGIMDLRTYNATTVSGRDGATVKVRQQQAGYYTLDQAATLLHVSKSVLETNEWQNIRGGAAVLAQEARQLHNGQLPSSSDNWYGAVALFSGAMTTSTGSDFADSVYATMQSGVTLTTTAGQIVSLPATPNLQPDKADLTLLGLRLTVSTMGTIQGGQPAECPITLKCRFIPAAYAQDDPNDPTNYGNYDPANRPNDMQIRYIFIHDGEGSYDSIINHFQDPTAYDSAQYVISTQGDVTQMVTNEAVSWGVGNWNMNMHGINIEHAGFAAQGASWYTPSMYQASATLVRWLATKYNIPIDRQHILGHDNNMRGPAASQAAQHWDPGPFWDWNYYMDLVKGETPAQATADYTSGIAAGALRDIRPGSLVTIAPNFATNQPVITDCQNDPCVQLPKQGANFVYLHSRPDEAAPLLSDPYLHTDGSAGTTRDDDWGDKAPSGYQYVVAAVKGNWIGIWYGGKIGWLHNTRGAGQVAFPALGATISPRPGLASIPVYTGAYPEASAYPAAIPVQPLNTPYTMNAGQAYVADDESVGSDYYYDATANYSLPDDHMIVVGSQRYYEITFNHHIGFVRVQDVVVRQ